MTFKITKPGFYRTRDGRKAEVVTILDKRLPHSFPVYGFVSGSMEQWRSDGTCGEPMDLDDLVAEWVEPVVYTMYVEGNGKLWWMCPPAGCKLHQITLRDGKIVDVTDEVG